MKISIIMPVFNAEATIASSLDSILGQLTRDIEVIFVDDGSTDNTLELISGFLHRNNIDGQLIHQTNEGVAAARNTGIDAANGDYLVFLDADDKFCEGAFPSIVKALKDSPDILGWDWINDYEHGEKKMRQADYESPADAIQNLMGGLMKWNLWLFAVKRSLIMENGIRFIPGANMGEDMQFIIKAFACSSSVCQLHESLYRYNASNPSSISKAFSARRRVEVERNFNDVSDYLLDSQHSELCKRMLPHLKLYIKRPLLISTSRLDYENWRNWWPEANRYAGKNHDLPLRVRTLQVMAAHRMDWGVWLYNKVVYSILAR